MTKFLPACSKALEPLPDPKHSQIPRSYIQHNKWIFHSKYCLVRKLAEAPVDRQQLAALSGCCAGLSPSAAVLVSGNSCPNGLQPRGHGELKML